MSREEQVLEALLEWHTENRRRFPWRDETDPYMVLVAEFFLQRTPAERVAKIYPKFIERYPNPHTLARVDPSKLMEEYRNLGLSKRMNWLVDSMKIVCKKYNGMIPDSKELLKELPGIGEYTASAILCFAFGKDIEIVDANVIRLYTRLFGIKTADVYRKAKKMIPDKASRYYNESILDFSSKLCKKNPKCFICILSQFCAYSNRE